MKALRWLVVVAMTGCAQPNPSNTTLVRVDDEAPGANCMFGGVSINTGRDTNKDDVLEDTEITSTNYVCNGGSVVRCGAGDTVHDGSVTIRDPNDFAALAGVTCIDGDLIVAGISGELAALPALHSVTGEVIVAGNNDMTTLDGFAGLRDIGQSYLVQGNDSLVDISQIAALDTVLSVFVVGNDAMTDVAGLSSLHQLRTKLTIANNGNLTSLHGLENLAVAQSWLVVRSNRNLQDISALANLRSAGALEISSNGALTNITLPALEKVDVRLLINLNAGLTSVSLPELTTLSDGIVFSGDPILQTVSMPSLLTTGVVTFENDTALTTISAPAFNYATVDVNFTNLNALTNVNMNALTTIGGTLSVYNVTPWSFAGFSNLSEVGSVWLNQAGMSSFAGLTALHTVGGNATIVGCPQLTSFSGLEAMTDIGNNLVISANPNLSLSLAHAFANSVTVGGTTTIN